MSIRPRGILGKYAERPPPCFECGLPAWWNGKRQVCSVHRRQGRIEHLTDIIRRRARCSSRDCPVGSWTIYEEDSYPHRVFQLVVVASAVATATIGKITLTAAAKAHRCSRDSVRRWIRWVSKLAKPSALMRVCTRLDPDGLPGGLVTSDMPRAAVVLHLLDRLADLLEGRGVGLPALDAGLARVLKHQLARYGDVYFLTKVSPPLRVALGDLRI